MTDVGVPPGQHIRVLIADDDQLVRAGIAGIIGTAQDIRIVAQASDGIEAVELASSHRIDVALLDIQMPRLDGIGALRAIRRTHPGLPIAMLTTFSDDQLIADAIGAGALGFLVKSDEPQHLIAGVRALAQGGGAFSPPIARWLATRERAAMRSDEESERVRAALTPRQLQLLTHVGQGLSNAQIADRMHLSEGTVKQYLSTLFSVLQLENRVQAAVLAYRIRLL